jgi:hypothetical protein
MSTELCFGLEDQERLCGSPEEVLEQWVIDSDSSTFEEAAAFVEWPMRFFVFKPMNHWQSRIHLAEGYLERILEDLDEEFGDPEGDSTKPTDGMNRAALAFVDSVLKEYTPYNYEKTGDVVEITREEARVEWEEYVSVLKELP